MARPLKKAPATDAGGTVTIGLRVDTALRRALEDEAASMDRNLSQECERRLRRSLDPRLMGADTIEAMRKAGGIWSEDARNFVADALLMLCGRDAGRVAVSLAVYLGLSRNLERTVPGAGIGVSKAALDEIKAAVREIERNCRITTKEEK